jgi:hypothetical protein
MKKGSAPGIPFRGYVCVHSLRPDDSLTILTMALSIGSQDSVSFLLTIQATGLLTVTLVGLPPTEYASLRWTHLHAGLSQRTCAPALPASASPTASEYAVRSPCRSISFQRTASSVLTTCVSRGGKRTSPLRTTSDEVEFRLLNERIFRQVTEHNCQVSLQVSA